MKRMPIANSKDHFEDVCGERPRSGNRDWMIKKIAWRLQADEEGGLPERVRQKALTMADDANLRVRPTRGIIEQVESAEQATSLPTADARDPRLPLSGSTLSKIYKGQELAVRVRQDSFEFNDNRGCSFVSVTQQFNTTSSMGPVNA